MNIFGNITSILNPVDTFLGKNEKQAITKQYIAPEVQQKPTMTLFSDEQKMFQRMKADNLSDDQSYGMLKKRRTDLLGGDGISADETKMLLRMQADNIPVKQAVAMIQKRRQDMAEKANSIHDLHADEGVVEQTLKAPFRAIGDVASQTWQGIGKGTEGLLDASFRGVNDLNRMIGSSDYSPELEKQLPQGGYLGDVAKIGAGTTGAVFNLGKAPLALGINTANQLPGAQYITQGIGKVIQYGAENLGEMTGVDKETSMDLATTGMNLFGMKPGMNTLQYGRGIVNAPGVMGKAGAIVKPVGESVVQTVKMPYDIAKGTIKGGVSLAKKVGPSIATASDAIQTGLNRMTKGEINKFQAEQGVSPGKYLNDRNIVSSGKPIEETLLEQMKASRDQATAGTEAIVGNFKMPTQKFGESEISYMREMLKDNYRHAKKTLDAEGTNQAKQLLDKYDTQGLTMGEINTAKRKMADNNPVNWNTDHASPRVQTVKRISDAVRNWQFDQAVKSGFTNLKEINKQTQAFYKLHEGITKWNDGIEANNKISLTDYLAFDADPSVFVAKKVLSSQYVRQGIVKGLNKISGRVVKPIEKATIDTINTKRAEYDYGNRNSNTGDRVATGEQLALPAPSGKATGAKNVRVNQPIEKSPIKNEGQVGKRPGTKPIVKPNTIKNESKVSEPVVVPKKIVNTPIEQKKSNIRSTEGSNDFVSYFQKDLGDNITKEGLLKFGFTEKQILDNTFDFLKSKDNKLGVSLEDLFAIAKKQKKPLTTPSNAKQQVSKPISSDTIPEGYFKNVFGEIQKLPSNKNGGFLRIGSESKKLTDPLVEEARKYKSGRNMYDVMPYDMREKFDRIGVYSLKHFEDFYKKNITNTKGEITMYRGQSKPGKQVQFNDTKFQGNTDGGVFFTPNKDIAKKYGENIIELKSNKNNTLLYKEAEKLQKMAEKMVSSNIKNGITSKSIIEQMALGRPKAFAEYTKKPFLETGDMFGEQGEMIYYKNFDNK